MTPLLDIIVKATAVLALAAMGDALLRRRGSAAARHLVWTMAIAALLALPVASIALPRWTVTIPVASAPLSGTGRYVVQQRWVFPPESGSDGVHVDGRAGA